MKNNAKADFSPVNMVRSLWKMAAEKVSLRNFPNTEAILKQLPEWLRGPANGLREVVASAMDMVSEAVVGPSAPVTKLGNRGPKNNGPAFA